MTFLIVWLISGVVAACLLWWGEVKTHQEKNKNIEVDIEHILYTICAVIIGIIALIISILFMYEVYKGSTLFTINLKKDEESE